MKHWRVILLAAGAAVGMVLGYFTAGESAQIGARVFTGGIVGAVVSLLLLSATSGSASGAGTGRRSFG